MLKIDSDAWAVMLRHAAECYPLECCGVLIGRNSGSDEAAAVEAIPCRNVDDGDRRLRFRMDPGEQVSAFEQAAARGLEVVGFFHSHPDRTADFSAEDLRNAWPRMRHVVLAVSQGNTAKAAAYRLDERPLRAVPEPLSHGPCA